MRPAIAGSAATAHWGPGRDVVAGRREGRNRGESHSREGRAAVSVTMKEEPRRRRCVAVGFRAGAAPLGGGGGGVSAASE